MKKSTKILTVMSTAAVMAIGASMTSMAATGWQQENGSWVFYNSSGDYVTDSWQKSGDYWFYLDEDGYIATDSIISYNDNFYYVNGDGVMITNAWIEAENENAGEDGEPDTVWYYFQSNGKAYKRSDSATTISLKTINGKKYAFDEDGQMLFGWVNTEGLMVTDSSAFESCDYYFGTSDDGAMSVGWVEIGLTDVTIDANEMPAPDYWDTDQTRWFYFQSSGKKVKDNTNKSINGKRYGFDEYGRMIASWYATESYLSSASEYMYFSTPEDGARYTKGWFKVVPSYYLNQEDYDDGAEYWYYAGTGGKIYTSAIKSINSKKYAFDANGRMLSGLVLLKMVVDDAGTVSTTDIDTIYDSDDNVYGYETIEKFNATCVALADELASGEYAFYYFSGDAASDGSMKTGSQTIEIDGESVTFSFKSSGSNKGQGLNGVSSSKIYVGGKLLKADSDDKVNIVVKTATGNGGYTYTTYSAESFISNAVALGYTIDTSKSTTDEDVWTITGATEDSIYVINTSGSILTSGNRKDGNDYRIYSKADGVTLYRGVEITLDK